MAKQTKLAGKSKGVPSPKKQAVKEFSAFEKQFQKITDELLKDEYQNRTFPEGVMTEVPASLLVQVMNERYDMEVMMGQLRNLLGGASNELEKKLIEGSALSYQLLVAYKKAVDSGITVAAQPREETPETIFTKRVETLLSVGFMRRGDEFFKDSLKFTAEQVFQMDAKSFDNIFESAKETVE